MEKYTKVNYLYRDCANYKVWNEAVLRGEITNEQEKAIYAAIADGENFVPSDVGLPETRFGSWNEDDVDVFELQGFETFEAPSDIETVMDIDELVQNFEACTAYWAAK